MIGSVKDFKIGGKTYSVKKLPASKCLEVQSIFVEMAVKSGVPMDREISKEEIDRYFITTMRGKLLADVKRVIIDSVAAPKLGEIDDDGIEGFEKLDYTHIPLIFMFIYDFNIGLADKKKEEQKDLSENDATAPTLKI